MNNMIKFFQFLYYIMIIKYIILLLIIINIIIIFYFMKTYYDNLLTNNKCINNNNNKISDTIDEDPNNISIVMDNLFNDKSIWLTSVRQKDILN